MELNPLCIKGTVRHDNTNSGQSISVSLGTEKRFQSNTERMPGK